MPLVKIRRSVHKDTSLINRKLPAEILIMIFLLLGPSTFKNPYVYLPLSSVCRRWRSIVFNTPRFWTIIEHKTIFKCYHEFTRDVILRSKSCVVDVKLDMIFYDHPLAFRNTFLHATSSILYFKNSQIRTLFLDKLPYIDFSAGENIAQLDNLILSRFPGSLSDKDQNSLTRFLSSLNPRLFELSTPLLYREMSQGLDRLEWLKLNVSRFALDSYVLSHVLKTLPNLRILNLIAGERELLYPLSPVINLPNLRMLSLDPTVYELCPIQAPTLSYLGVFPIVPGMYRWDHLDGVDLSIMKSFRIAPCHNQYALFLPKKPVACISTGLSEEDCDFFNHFHTSVSRSNKSMDDHWTLPPPNSFHISFEYSSQYIALYTHLRRATNLVELIVDFGPMKFNKSENKYHAFLGRILYNFHTVVHLSVLRSRSFGLTCELLMVGQRLPRLERLTYHSSYYNLLWKPQFVPKLMAKVQHARTGAGSKPLKDLELKNFLFIHPTVVEKIEELGIRFKQTEIKRSRCLLKRI